MRKGEGAGGRRRAPAHRADGAARRHAGRGQAWQGQARRRQAARRTRREQAWLRRTRSAPRYPSTETRVTTAGQCARRSLRQSPKALNPGLVGAPHGRDASPRSEEHTSELKSLMRISYAVFCLKKKKDNTKKITRQN